MVTSVKKGCALNALKYCNFRVSHSNISCNTLNTYIFGCSFS